MDTAACWFEQTGPGANNWTSGLLQNTGGSFQLKIQVRA